VLRHDEAGTALPVLNYLSGRRSGAEMSRYFFDVKNGHRLIDPAGLDCRDDQEARGQAIHIAHQIAMEAPHASGGRHVAIMNSDGQEIGKVPVRLNGQAAE
jgi:hypothetical protein